MVNPRCAGAVLQVALFVVPAAAQRAWVVAPSPGPGVDFTTVQLAVDAAVDGDVVLVLAGADDAFRIDGKSLVVVRGFSVSSPGSNPVPAQLTAAGLPVFFQMVLTSPSSGCFVGSPTALLVVASGL